MDPASGCVAQYNKLWGEKGMEDEEGFLGQINKDFLIFMIIGFA